MVLILQFEHITTGLRCTLHTTFVPHKLHYNYYCKAQEQIKVNLLNLKIQLWRHSIVLTVDSNSRIYCLLHESTANSAFVCTNLLICEVKKTSHTWHKATKTDLIRAHKLLNSCSSFILKSVCVMKVVIINIQSS